MIAMNRDYYDDVISFDSLYKSLGKVCNGVRWKDSVIGYENNGLVNTYKLRQNLLNDDYKISKYQVFTIHEPKERVIQAARIVDRQFQRSLCENGLYEDLTEHFITDNVACQKNKGILFGLYRMNKHLTDHVHKYGTDGYFLKCDIHHFFQESRHDALKRFASKNISDEKAKIAVNQIIDSFGGDKGVGLGSEVSQLLELMMLNELDHFIKEKLRIKKYVRYMDDFVLVHKDKNYLIYCLKEIKAYLATIGLKLNSKTSINKLTQGFRFLKWKFLVTETRRVLMLMDTKRLSKKKIS